MTLSGYIWLIPQINKNDMAQICIIILDRDFLSFRIKAAVHIGFQMTILFHMVLCYNVELTRIAQDFLAQHISPIATVERVTN